jgi:hypothetical protein
MTVKRKFSSSHSSQVFGGNGRQLHVEGLMEIPSVILNHFGTWQRYNPFPSSIPIPNDIACTPSLLSSSHKIKLNTLFEVNAVWKRRFQRKDHCTHSSYRYGAVGHFALLTKRMLSNLCSFYVIVTLLSFSPENPAVTFPTSKVDDKSLVESAANFSKRVCLCSVLLII